jgi:DNA invertase Pin-like site-specific DNA recombinase
MGRFMISIMSAFSELEREMIVERVVAGVKKAQAAGKHCGRPGASSGGTGSWS